MELEDSWRGRFAKEVVLDEPREVEAGGLCQLTQRHNGINSFRRLESKPVLRGDREKTVQVKKTGDSDVKAHTTVVCPGVMMLMINGLQDTRSVVWKTKCCGVGKLGSWDKN